MKFLKILFYLFIIFVILPTAFAVVSSLSLSWVWEWFLQARYGAGPSLGQWFGIASIIRMATVDFQKNMKKGETPDGDIDEVFWREVRKSVAFIVMVLPCTFLLKGIGLLLGWVQ